MNAQEILNKALEKLEINTDLVPAVVQGQHPQTKYDALVQLNDLTLATEVKRQINRHSLGAVINQLLTVAEGNIPLLVAEYINANMGDKLRAENINYLDTVGNAYINCHPTYILLRGNKAPNQVKRTTGRAFTPTGLKVIYALLVDPELLNATYRDLAEAANVALGAIGWVLRDLKAQDYIQQGITTKQRRWNKETKAELIDKWVERYPELKQKQLIERYSTNNSEWWKKANLKKYQGLFGGEIAANKYTRHLKPQDHLVYIDKAALNEFLTDFRLGLKKTDGVEMVIVDVVAKFWGTTLEDTEQGLTTPLLTYADLIASADVRNRETAMIIREQFFNE